MPRPVTLFTGQFADLPFTELCLKAADWGYDGLEIACWGDHFEVDRALSDDTYVQGRRDQAILPARVWGDGEPEGVRRRAAEEIKDTARAAARLGVDTVIGFTGSSIWHTVAMFPPVPAAMVERGYANFADRWNPILDVPSHFVWQDLDPVGFLWDFRDRIGDVPWEPVFRMLNSIGYDGPISVEWEDAGMDRELGAPDALAFVRALTAIEPPAASFDAAFSAERG